MPTVTNTLKAPDGTLVSTAAVQIELAGTDGVPIKGYVTAGDYSFIGYHQPTVTAGVWSVTLVANTLINPAGTRWKVSETYNSRTHIYYLSVPDGAGPYFVEDILDEAPGTLASSALTAHITAEEASRYPYVIPIMSGVSGVALTTTLTSLASGHVALDAADFSAPTGYEVQWRMVATVYNLTAADVAEARLVHSLDSSVVIASFTGVAPDSQVFKFSSSWAAWPAARVTGVVQVRNQTAARGSFRAARLEFQTVEI